MLLRTTKSSRRLLIGASIIVGAVSPSAWASYTFTPLSDPAAIAGFGGTNAAGIYGSTIVGDYGDTAGHHGFIYNGSSFANFNEPSASPTPVTNKLNTFATGIFGTTIVGTYAGASGGYGFTDTNGSFATISVPSANVGTYAQGISGSTVVGYTLTYNGAQGFSFDGTSYTILNDPLAVGVSGNVSTGTFIHGIDGTTLVGSYTSGTNNLSQGFFERANNFTTLSDRFGLNGTVATAISGNTIVGYYLDAASVAHGFVDNGGTFSTVDDPADIASTGTVIEGISGTTIVGYFGGLNSSSKMAFIASSAIPEPDMSELFAMGGLGLLIRRRGSPHTTA